MARVFLSAQWRDLIIASYSVDPHLLMARLPAGLELDLFEGQAVCSLVGFRFLRTRVFGVRWPGYVNFPEINLRFYVREQDGDRRGVVFVRELVRSRIVAGIAKRVYNEPYVKAKIGERVVSSEELHRAEYRFTYKAGLGEMRACGDPEAHLPDEDTAEHWFKEHQWGYGTNRKGDTLRYEVRHPFWRCHRVRTAEIAVDWGRVYGQDWAGMNHAEPLSVMLAEGSEIEVCSAEPL